MVVLKNNKKQWKKTTLQETIEDIFKSFSLSLSLIKKSKEAAFIF